MNIFNKKFWADSWSFICSALTGLKLLAEAGSLIIVSGYAIWAAFNINMDKWQQRILLTAAAIILIRGSYEFMRHLTQLGGNTRKR